jgi:hypothetical protein
MGHGGDPTALDAGLAALARAEAGLRLGLGQVLEALGSGGVFELGFSSLAAYALERCERSARWVEGARCLARRLEPLPDLRKAVATGEVAWSMAECVARAAQPEAEARWLALAHEHTVREMRIIVDGVMAERAASGAGQVVSEQHGPEPGMVGEVASNVGVSRAEAPCEAVSDEAVSDEAESDEAESDEAVSEEAESDEAVSDEAVSEEAERAGVMRDETGSGERPGRESGDEEMCTLVCTVAREEAWLFEATRHLLEHLGEHESDAQIEALLAEGQVTLLAELPGGALDVDGLEKVDTQQQRWKQQLECWRVEAEVRCEERVRAGLRGSPSGTGTNSVCGLMSPPEQTVSDAAATAALGLAALRGATARQLDAVARRLSRALARQDLELSRALLRFHRADGWRRLGYATEAQYARERLGVSRSSLLSRRSLALRLEALPQVAEALGQALFGVEAAVQLVRIATPRTEGAWVERAQQRTIKHLREEVVAALTAVRLSGEVDCLPPRDSELGAFQELERAVVSGGACQRRGRVASSAAPSSAVASSARSFTAMGGSESNAESRRAWQIMLASLGQWLEGGVQLSAASGPASAKRASAGRVRLRLRVSRSTYCWWRGLEAQARRWLPRGMSWLKFLCLSFWQGWRQMLGADVAYGQIYLRDRYRCTSPVCSRKDVTPHHLQFRSTGGSDDDANVAAVCTCCHLFGIHGGRIRAAGTAQCIHWEFGPPKEPCLIVHGRQRRAA